MARFRNAVIKMFRQYLRLFGRRIASLKDFTRQKHSYPRDLWIGNPSNLDFMLSRTGTVHTDRAIRALLLLFKRRGKY